jgi:hypothetical protein
VILKNMAALLDQFFAGIVCIVYSVSCILKNMAALLDQFFAGIVCTVYSVSCILKNMGALLDQFFAGLPTDGSKKRVLYISTDETNAAFFKPFEEAGYAVTLLRHHLEEAGMEAGTLGVERQKDREGCNLYRCRWRGAIYAGAIAILTLAPHTAPLVLSLAGGADTPKVASIEGSVASEPLEDDEESGFTRLPIPQEW